MIEIKALFEKYEVICPDWLSEELLEDEWLDSEHLFDGGVHKWVLDEVMRYVVLSFDGEEYRMQALDESREHVIFEERITEEEHMIT